VTQRMTIVAMQLVTKKFLLKYLIDQSFKIPL